MTGASIVSRGYGLAVVALAAACSRGGAAPTAPPIAATPTPVVRWPGPRLDAAPIACEFNAYDQQPASVELACADIRHSVMQHPRVGPLAVALAGGRVLVVGGDVDGASTAELFEPAAGRWLEVPPPPGFAGADDPATTLVADGDGARALTATVTGGAIAITAARLDVTTRAWSPPRPLPIAPPTGRWVPHVAAARLTDGALLVTSAGQAALEVGGRWHRLPDLPDDDFVSWAAPLAGGDALVGGLHVLARRPREAWLAVASPPDRVGRGNYAPIVVGDGRVALVGGCSDGGECWGDSEVDVFDAAARRYRTSEAVLQREHSVGPAGVAVSGPDRLLLTSDFSGNRELEHCTIGSPPERTAVCRCGACDVPERDHVAIVSAGGDCLLVIGGSVGDAPTADVLRLCWSDRPWTAPAEPDQPALDDE